MRTIESKRSKQTGENYHYCPRTQGIATLDDCRTCSADGETFIEELSVSYRVHCAFGEAVQAIIPSHIEDQIPQSWGTDKFALPQYTVIEPKLDGARAILLVTKTGIRVFSRRNNRFGDQSEFTESVPHIANLRLSGLEGAILDGELICQPGGVSASGNIPAGTLGATMSVVGSSPEEAIRTQEQSGKAHVYIFDLPKVRDEDLTEEKWLLRHSRMQHILLEMPHEAREFLHQMPFSEVDDALDVDTAITTKKALHERFLAQGAEGSVLKDPSATYYALRAGLKIKEDVTLDVIVTGFEYGKMGGRYESTVGALLCSVRDAATGELVEICKVAPGSDEKRAELEARFDELEARSLSFTSEPIIIWLQAQCWTKDYRMRHPRILEYCQDRDVPTTVDFMQVVRK